MLCSSLTSVKNQVYLKGNTKGITVRDIVKITMAVSLLEQKIQLALI